jgi:hypothetical protein
MPRGGRRQKKPALWRRRGRGDHPLGREWGDQRKPVVSRLEPSIRPVDSAGAVGGALLGGPVLRWQARRVLRWQFREICDGVLARLAFELLLAARRVRGGLGATDPADLGDLAHQLGAGGGRQPAKRSAGLWILRGWHRALGKVERNRAAMRTPLHILRSTSASAVSRPCLSALIDPLGGPVEWPP